jgi:hypothetical protein
MKQLLISLTLIFCGIATGTPSRPKQIRVSLQFIEVQHTTLTEMLASQEKSGYAMHTEAVNLTKNGQAKILESCMLICHSGEKASLESIREEIYPTEYWPSLIICGKHSNAQLDSEPPANPLFRTPSAFDTRNTGTTFEIQPSLTSNGTIDLRLIPEIITPLRLETWMEHIDQWGDGSIRMPIYETWRTNSVISVESGKFELVTALTPKTNAPVPSVSRKILIFVRADILPTP